jgi:protein-L-isoaspartate(D-aspartate) O-methyltransferase
MFSYSSSSSSNTGLINLLKREQRIKTDFVKRAMLKVDRKHFLRLPNTLSQAYEDSPQPLNDQVTISAPHMHATALEYLSEQLKTPGCKVLDVGSGSGYLVACMLQAIIENEGKVDDNVRVIGIEYLNDIAEFSRQALKQDLMGQDNAEQIENMYRILHGDGWKGVPEYAPFNAIHVGAAADDIPQKLVDQLAVGGRMVIPVGKQRGIQYLCVVDKKQDGSITVKKVSGVRYVPLVNPDHEKAVSTSRKDL